MRDRYDVVVIGAGPGGGSAAYHAAKAGLSVLLVDRARFPREKVCGDGLSPRAMRILARMGLGHLVGTSRRIEAARFIDGVRGDDVLHALGSSPRHRGYGTVVPRRALDEDIRRAAEDAGAAMALATRAHSLRLDRHGRVRGVHVEGIYGKGPIEGRVTIVADGAAGRLSRELRGALPPAEDTVGFAVRRYVRGVAGLPPHFEFHVPVRYRSQPLVGYSWIFPVSDNLANVGLGLYGRPEIPGGASILDVFEDALVELLGNDPRFAHAGPASPAHGASLGPRMVDPATVAPGALLVGDSAGLVNPFTAEGIAYALESGELAARAAAREVRPHEGSPCLYGAELRARYPRHIRSGNLEGSLRWLGTLGVPSLLSPRPDGLSAAVQDLVFDQNPTARIIGRDFLGICEGAMTDRLYTAIRRSIRTKVRALSPLMAEIVDNLLLQMPPSCVAPVVVAGAVSARGAALDGAFFEAMVGVTLFTLAHSILGEGASSKEGELRRDHVSGRRSVGQPAHIVIGDCLMTEAACTVAPLPESIYRSVVRAQREAAGAAIGTIRPCALSVHYDAMAAPTAAAVAIAVRTNGSVLLDEKACLRFARWYAATALASADLRKEPAEGLRQYVADLLTIFPESGRDLPAPLQRLGNTLETRCATLVADRAAAPDVGIAP